MRRFFCSCCGKEITDEYNRVVIRNKQGKSKDETILRLCEDDKKLVERIKLIPQKNVRIRTLPQWYNVKLVHCEKGSKDVEKTLYMIPEWNLDQLYALSKADRTKLRTVNGDIFYTKELVLLKTAGDDELSIKFLLKCLRLLYMKQTEDEKKEYKTKWHNNVGFQKADAKFLTIFAKITYDKSDDALSPKQLEIVRKRFKKYAEQAANLLNEEIEEERAVGSDW